MLPIFTYSYGRFSSDYGRVMLDCMIKAETHDDPEPTAQTPVDRAEDDQRSAPPRVYRAKDGHWIVEPPPDAMADGGTIVFTGSQAQHDTLTFAHQKFGNARFFPY
jgi:hypothetical protein